MPRTKGFQLTDEHKAKIRAARIRAGARSVGLATNLRHGMSGTPTWVSWRKMHERCSRGGKYEALGVLICADWAFFENFLADMGERPVGLTLDRIDPEGHYEPGNCRWATPEQQAANTRRGKHSLAAHSNPMRDQSSLSINPLSEEAKEAIACQL